MLFIELQKAAQFLRRLELERAALQRLGKGPIERVPHRPEGEDQRDGGRA